MLYGIALQAARALADGDVAVQQVILVPAASIAWSRSISTTNPRRTWREGLYALDDRAWNHSAVQRSFNESFDKQHEQPWRLTTDVPVLFHIKDDEYGDLASGTMPRNVALRYQRAIDAHNATLIGAHAHKPGDVFDSVIARINDGMATLAKAPAGDGTTAARVSNVLKAVAMSV